MGVMNWLIKSLGNINSLSDTAQKYYEPQLKALGLGKEEIQNQTIQELESSLATVDEALSRRETFGTIRLKVMADGGIVVSSTDEGFLTNIGPTLLTRKALIVQRIRQLKSIEEVGTLRGLVEAHVADPVRATILEKIDNAEKEANEWRQKAREIEDAQRQEKLKVDAELLRMEAEGKLFEKRAMVWQSLLARESVASVVGSILLLLIAIALLVAMFVGTETTEIVGNAFLVLLGYFFGQTTSRKSGDGGSAA